MLLEVDGEADIRVVSGDRVFELTFSTIKHDLGFLCFLELKFYNVLMLFTYYMICFKL